MKNFHPSETITFIHAFSEFFLWNKSKFLLSFCDFFKKLGVKTSLNLSKYILYYLYDYPFKLQKNLLTRYGERKNTSKHLKSQSIKQVFKSITWMCSSFCISISVAHQFLIQISNQIGSIKAISWWISYFSWYQGILLIHEFFHTDQC